MQVRTLMFMLEARCKKQVLHAVKKVMVFPGAPFTATSIPVLLVPKEKHSCRDEPGCFTHTLLPAISEETLLLCNIRAKLALDHGVEKLD